MDRDEWTLKKAKDISSTGHPLTMELFSGQKTTMWAFKRPVPGTLKTNIQ
jgi:hypothetical protein